MTQTTVAPPGPTTTPGLIDGVGGAIDSTVMAMDWKLLSWLHWSVAPEQVAAKLPEGVEVDLHDGRAWVGLIPFDMRDIRPPGGPRGLPWVGTFPETNVRTYVRGPDGRRAVWFLSLDASRLAAVAVARATYDLPYFWSSMRIRPRRGGGLVYTTRRRGPGPAGATSRLALRVGRPVAPDDLDRFLSERYALLVQGRDGAIRRAPVQHEPWPLHEAEVVSLQDELLAAAGFPGLAARPPDRVRFSPGVAVRVGPPRRA